MNSRILKGRQRLNKELNQHGWRTYRQLLGRLCENHIAHSPARTILGLLRNKDFDGLYDYADSLSTQTYVDARDHFLANQFSALIKKYPFPRGVTSLNPDLKAREKFFDAEQKCAATNEFLRKPFIGWDLETSFVTMQRYIAYVIGESPDVASCLQKCGFGPGASLGVHGDGTSMARKLHAEAITVTPGAFAYATSAFRHNHHLMEFISAQERSLCFELSAETIHRFLTKRLQFVAHNKITFVPKTSKTHRSIAVEPLVNGFIQKGIDTYLRHRLKRVGINLEDQFTNKAFAQLASAEWTSEDPFVTIDLSSASDSISQELCRRLLPPDWYSFLNCIRSSRYELDGKVYTYHKFCSMGNGFCFPLETLVFAAAVHASGGRYAGKDFFVYGDDIICRKSVADKLIPLLDKMGFGVNQEKTFLSGPFRESCGGDYFAGEDVRPFTFDFALDSLESIFKFLNLTRRNRRTEAFFDGVRDFVLSLVPSDLRLYRPKGINGNADVAITSVEDEFLSSPHVVWNKNLQCWRWRELSFASVSDDFWTELEGSDVLLLIAALRGSSPEVPFAWRRKTRTTVRKVSYGAVGAKPIAEGVLFDGTW